MSEEDKRRKASWKRLKGTTNFYPTYVDGNLDKVTPAAATHSTQFQTVIPRYDLSMSETRNAGTGPTFLIYMIMLPPRIRILKNNPRTHLRNQQNEKLNCLATKKRKSVPIFGNKTTHPNF